jgi:hypothetical protein
MADGLVATDLDVKKAAKAAAFFTVKLQLKSAYRRMTIGGPR